MGDHLVINGDLFDFWFEYKSVIQREHFATLTALAKLRESGVRLTLTGGNHDRWGVGFWEKELGAEFSRGPLRTELAGWKSWVVHGDGVAELKWSGKLTHAICSFPGTARVFRMLHPELGFGVVRRIRRFICAPRDDEELYDRAAAAQAEYARGFLAEHADIDLLVLGHTHRPALESTDKDQWYLNPGAWMDGYSYAVISSEGPELRRFEDSGSG
jgi:UDP-2,3-diacylglucosamine hydrolase